MIVTASAIALVPWIVNLALTLPQRYVATDWRLTWVGFDIALLAFLAATAWLGWHRRQLVLLTAFTTGVLLCCDAWFDVTTAEHHDRFTSVAAAFVEIPLAILLFRASWRLLRLAAGALGTTAPTAPACPSGACRSWARPNRPPIRPDQPGPLRRPVRPAPTTAPTELPPLRPLESLEMSLRSHARFCYIHRRWVVVAWVVVFVALQVVVSAAGTNFTTSFSAPNTESTRAQNLLLANFKAQSGDSVQVVMKGTPSMADPAGQGPGHLAAGRAGQARPRQQRQRPLHPARWASRARGRWRWPTSSSTSRPTTSPSSSASR